MIESKHVVSNASWCIYERRVIVAQDFIHCLDITGLTGISSIKSFWTIQ